MCNFPAAAATTPARIALYGHGLFGDLTEVNGGLARTMAEQHDIAYCATNWYGMAEEQYVFYRSAAARIGLAEALERGGRVGIGLLPLDAPIAQLVERDGARR